MNCYGRRVVDFVCGRRNTLTFNKMWNRICEMDVGVFCSDGWKSYAQRSKATTAGSDTIWRGSSGRPSVIQNHNTRWKYIPKITLNEMGQLAENAICLTISFFIFFEIVNRFLAMAINYGSSSRCGSLYFCGGGRRADRGKTASGKCWKKKADI